MSFVGSLLLVITSIALLSGCALSYVQWASSKPADGYLACGTAKGVVDGEGFVNVEALTDCVKRARASDYDPSDEDECRVAIASAKPGDRLQMSRYYVEYETSTPWLADWKRQLRETTGKRIRNAPAFKTPENEYAYYSELTKRVWRPEVYFNGAWKDLVAPELGARSENAVLGRTGFSLGYTKGCLLKLIPRYAAAHKQVRIELIREVLEYQYAKLCFWRTLGAHPDADCQRDLEGFADAHVRLGKLVESVWIDPNKGASASVCSKYLEENAVEGIRPTEDDRQFAARRSEAQAALANWRAFEAGKASAGDASALATTIRELPECKTQVMRAIVQSVPHWRAALAGSERAAAQRVNDAKAADVKAEAERVKAERQAVLKRRFEPIVKDCERSWQSTHAKCTELPGLSDEERAQCQKACADAAEAARTKVLDDARASCIETWADTGVPSVCNLEVPDGAKPDPQWLKSETASCSAECRKQGPEARRERVLAQQRAAREEAERAREAAAERARNPGPSASTRFCRSQCKSQGMSCLEQNCGCDNPNVSCPLTACSAACLRQKNACDARCGD
jgi:hypothetical protein